MLLLPISIALCLLTMPLARGAVALERQVEESPNSAVKTVTKIVFITSTTTPSLPTPTTSRFFVTYTHSGQISVSTATVTLLPVVPTSTLHRSSSPSPSSVTSSSGDSGDSRSKGAIAGGVLGALAAIVAIFAAFICYRRRSPKHWRNRAVGRWHVTDSKDAGTASSRAIYVGEPMYKFQDNTKQSDLEPLPPLYIRDRQPTGDPFNDPPDSPSSHRAHTRSVSTTSAAYQGSDSPGNLHIELQPRLR